MPFYLRTYGLQLYVWRSVGPRWAWLHFDLELAGGKGNEIDRLSIVIVIEFDLSHWGHRKLVELHKFLCCVCMHAHACWFIFLNCFLVKIHELSHNIIPYSLYMCKDAKGVNGPGVLAVLTWCCLNINGLEPRANGRCISIGSFVMRMDH